MATKTANATMVVPYGPTELYGPNADRAGWWRRLAKTLRRRAHRLGRADYRPDFALSLMHEAGYADATADLLFANKT